MSKQDKLLLRRRILGVLIRDARQAVGRSCQDCAAFLGIPAARLEAIELGQQPISLPELEALAYLMEVPLDHLMGDQLLSPVAMKEPPSRQMLDLRNRIVGALLLQARTAAGQSREACAQAIGVSESDLSAYEFGRVPIPLSELEALAHHLQTPIEAFVDAEHNPVAQRAMRQQKPATMEHLPTELQQFVEEPLNVDYLRTAYRLSQIPGDRLRMIAEALLEITY